MSERRVVVRQAPEGLPMGAIALVAGGAAVVTAAALGVAWWLTPEPGSRDVSGQRVRSGGTVAGVDLARVDAVARGLERQQAKRRYLETYGWVSREQGLVHIPIERAMQQLADGQRPPGAGASAFGPTAAPAAGGGERHEGQPESAPSAQRDEPTPTDGGEEVGARRGPRAPQRTAEPSSAAADPSGEAGAPRPGPAATEAESEAQSERQTGGSP